MKKILVLDDEKAVAELIKLLLERNGFEVTLAYDGIEGLGIISKVKPDLILLDVLMPRMDGFQFYKKIKEDKNTSGTPVLVMTARGAMRDSFEGLGVESFLVKPFEPEELLAQVKKILSDLPSRDYSQDSTSQPIQSHKTALIAGSDNERLHFMRSQLEKKGYKVEWATDGPHALAKVLSLLPDLFLVQFDMPQMSADDIIKNLRNSPEAKNVSVIVYSPLATKEIVPHSEWDRFLLNNQKKELRSREVPLKVVEKFDKDSFLDKIKDFL